MQLFIEIEAPHHWAVVGRDGRVVEAGRAESLDVSAIESRYQRVIGVIPGEQVLSRQVTLPTKNRKKATAAIPYALEESLSADVEDLAFCVMRWDADGVAHVCVIAKELLQHWIHSAEQANIRLDGIVPDFLLVPLHPQAEMTIARDTLGDINIRMGAAQGVKLDPESFGIWWSELQNKDVPLAVNDRAIAKQLVQHHTGVVSEWDIGDNIINWLENSSDLPVFNLLQGEYQPRHHREGSSLIRWAAVLAGIALVLKLAVTGAEFAFLYQQNQQLDQQISAQFSAIFPDANEAKFPRKEAENRIVSLERAGSSEATFQVLLSAVANAVPRSNAKVEELAYRDDALIVTCSVADFAGLDRLKTSFSQVNGVVTELISSGSRDNRTSGRFRLQRGTG